MGSAERIIRSTRIRRNETRMKVSIITATFNRAQQMKSGLKTILSQDLPGETELIVVDDGSTDNTREMCADIAEIARTKHVGFKYIYLDHPEPRISCIPHNVGAKEAKGDILIFTESECLHIGNTIQQLLDKVDDKTVPLATQIWTMGERIWKQLFDVEEQFKPEYMGFLLKHPYAMLTDAEHPNNTKAPDSDWGITGSLNCYAGCLFAVKKENFLAVGGYDESFEGFGWDDWDLLHRLELYGGRVEQCNDIIVIHQWHEKNYPYNIYDCAEKNGKISEANVKAGKYKVNDGEDWRL